MVTVPALEDPQFLDRGLSFFCFKRSLLFEFHPFLFRLLFLPGFHVLTTKLFHHQQIVLRQMRANHGHFQLLFELFLKLAYQIMIVSYQLLLADRTFVMPVVESFGYVLPDFALSFDSCDMSLFLCFCQHLLDNLNAIEHA